MSIIELEKYMDNINYIDRKNLSVDEFYKSLFDKYLYGKYSQNIISPKSYIFGCLKVTTAIHGLGIASASGLLSILFPEYFGTVDQLAVQLREIPLISNKDDIAKRYPDSLKKKDCVVLFNIMRKKQMTKKNYLTPVSGHPEKLV